ncbi:pyridoxamine 5'-phosphate oxidase family protein [Paenibacillus tarimensis]
MKIIRDRSRSFELNEFLKRPLFAHLATASDEGPRESPVWFHWEVGQIWIIGTASDSFPGRIEKEPKCAIGIIDFDVESGKVYHAGFRGHAVVKAFDKHMANKLLARYLGPHQESWDPRFKELDVSNVLICFTPETVVVRDQSYIAAAL